MINMLRDVILPAKFIALKDKTCPTRCLFYFSFCDMHLSFVLLPLETHAEA